MHLVLLVQHQLVFLHQRFVLLKYDRIKGIIYMQFAGKWKSLRESVVHEVSIECAEFMLEITVLPQSAAEVERTFFKSE